MTAPNDEDTPVPASPSDGASPAAEDASSEAVIRDRPGGRRADAALRLDKAMKGARGLKTHVPYKEIEVDDRAVRRAVRWGRAEDARAATLDEVMKQRRQVQRMAKDGKAEIVLAVPQQAPTAEAAPEGSTASKQLILWASILAVVVLGVMAIVAIKLL